MSLANKKIVFLFPGQGAQYENMGSELIENNPVYAAAKEVLSEEVFEVIREGKKEALEKTKYCQPAIFLNSLALYFEFKKAITGYDMADGTDVDAVFKSPLSDVPATMIGLSLGEYTALCAGGKISLSQAIELVNTRGNIMSKGVQGKGAMIAIMRPNLDLLKDIVEETVKNVDSDEVIAICNYNSPQQVVVGGTFKALDEFERLCVEKGVKKIVRINVEGPFHTEVLKESAEEFENFLKNVEYLPSDFRIYSNVDGNVYGDEMNKAQIVQKLKRQMFSPVRFQECVQEAIKCGYDTFVEIGAGKTLSSFVKKIDKTVEVLNVEKLEDVECVLAKLNSQA